MLNPSNALLNYYYDELTYDMPYDLWVDIISYFGSEAHSVLDLGCGTGELTKRLSFEDIEGLDISEQMIEAAKMKNPNIKFHTANMTDFKLDRSFDMSVATVDVMNYLNDETSFVNTLRNVKSHLNEEGIFIFDVHSVYKMEHDFNDMTYSDETEHLVYIWNAIREETPLTVTHDMTFFIKDSQNLYHRYDETSRQRTYTHKHILQMIEEAGLIVDTVFSDFAVDNPVTEVCDRIFYIVKKAL